MNYNDIRNKTRKIKVGSIFIGGDSKITVQSMTNTDTHDIEATYRQVASLERSGCDIVRITVPDEESAIVFRALKERGIKIPLVADIHFNHRIAISAIKCGADKIRINPGNIGSEDGVAAVVATAKEYGVPIRIGVNAGSLSKEILEKYGHPTPEALVESALSHVVSRISLLPMRSSAEVGSSQMRSLGLPSRAWAIPRRCFMPRENPRIR